MERRKVDLSCNDELCLHRCFILKMSLKLTPEEDKGDVLLIPFSLRCVFWLDDEVCIVEEATR